MGVLWRKYQRKRKKPTKNPKHLPNVFPVAPKLFVDQKLLGHQRQLLKSLGWKSYGRLKELRPGGRKKVLESTFVPKRFNAPPPPPHHHPPTHWFVQKLRNRPNVFSKDPQLTSLIEARSILCHVNDVTKPGCGAGKKPRAALVSTWDFLRAVSFFARSVQHRERWHGPQVATIAKGAAP